MRVWANLLLGHASKATAAAAATAPFHLAFFDLLLLLLEPAGARASAPAGNRAHALAGHRRKATAATTTANATSAAKLLLTLGLPALLALLCTLVSG